MTGTTLIATMADRYNMDPTQFAKTVRATVMPSEHTNEQFAAFMMVAYQYGLNPITREIYAYPGRKGGGINPVVSLDGWVNLVNSHPQCDGFDIRTQLEGDKLVSATCTIWRKDRTHPVVVTEYYSECYRNTDPWNQMPKRMLRHKAFKEAARLAFGFAGITDEDEARDMMARATETVRTTNALDDFTVEVSETIDGTIEDGIVVDDDPPQVSDDSGSSEQPTSPPPPGSPAAAAPDREEAIFKILQLANDKALTVDQRIENLEQLKPHYEDLHTKAFVKDLFQIGGRVAKAELSADKARTYLRQLP
jgi:phage recombination protein Bet